MEGTVAESANPPNTPAGPAPAPAPVVATPVAAPPARQTGKFMASLAKLLTTTTCLVLGLGFIFMGVIVKLRPEWVPGFVKPTLTLWFPHLPYFVVGLGLFFLGWARSMAAQQLISEYRKNRQYPHSWKIPLVSFQAFLLEACCFIYALPVALGWYPPLQNLMGLVWVVFFFMLYILWYITAYSVNRFPAIAGLRMAIVTVALSVVSFILWWAAQLVFPALLVGILAIFALCIALFIRVKGVEQVGFWPHKTLLVVSIFLLAHVTYSALPFRKPCVDLINLTLATKSLSGQVLNLAYFSKDNHNGNKISFSQKTDNGWLLQLINPEKPSSPILKIQAGDESFRSLFINDGNFLLADMTKNGDRGLWKVNVETGKTTLLRRNIQPMEEGNPWSESRGEVLYVTQSEGRNQLNIFTLATGKSKVLVTSENPIHTPSWVPPLNPPHDLAGHCPESEVAYADGVHGLFYLVNIKTGEKEPLMSQAERSLDNKFVAEGKATKVIPAPDGFRYLYLAEKDKKNELWLVLADGTKRGMIYQTTASLEDIVWHPDGQKIVFEEVHHGWDLGFLTSFSVTKLLDANLGTCLNLLPPQISTRSPAVASDGVKVAFVAGEGLWYPSMGHGIWVATLR
jgi:hypothetical protein